MKDISKIFTSDITQDSFLGGRVLIYQPLKGYRAGIDSVFLSASVCPLKGQSILDVGSGVGTASLLLLKRAYQEHPFFVIGLEKHRVLSEISTKNAAANGVEPFFRSVEGELQDCPLKIREMSFDHVMTNPPFFQGAMVSPDPLKAHANHSLNVSFQEWVNFCIKRLKPFGILTLIVPPDRLSEILVLFEERVGNIVIYPLWQREEVQAKRLLIQGIKGRKTPLRLLKGLVLHNEDHTFTPQARKILWEGEPLLLR